MLNFSCGYLKSVSFKICATYSERYTARARRIWLTRTYLNFAAYVNNVKVLSPVALCHLLSYLDLLLGLTGLEFLNP